jgi:formylmethanofuran dehydrogenase subunit C
MKKYILLSLVFIFLLVLTGCKEMKIPTDVSIDCGDGILVERESMIPEVTLYYDDGTEEKSGSFGVLYTLSSSDPYAISINGNSIYASYRGDTILTVIPDYNLDISAECEITIIRDDE